MAARAIPTPHQRFQLIGIRLDNPIGRDDFGNPASFTAIAPVDQLMGELAFRYLVKIPPGWKDFL